ncbi:hypothetical protein ACFVHW_29815 [Streptomyces sp. NPDC127110]|uniref:hypothetical protein n=1 Tax=Streptomyces sp. NPDC127110 TaxID=3345362 RepID=UPI003624F4CE
MRNFLKSSLVAVAAIVVCGVSTTAANAAAPGGGDGLGGSVIGSGNSYNWDANFAAIELSPILNLIF